jgi:DNA invertase Pin-like site-specific DNA recombinase
MAEISPLRRRMIEDMTVRNLSPATQQSYVHAVSKFSRYFGRSQDAEPMAAGCAKVFKEKVSGAKTDRPELAKVIGRLEPGDVLAVTRLDRLARSTRDLLNVIAAVSERGAGFKSLKDTWADTTTAHGRLMLTVLGGLAEFERELIRSRTGEGRKRAKDRGVKLRRRSSLRLARTPHPASPHAPVCTEN